MKPASIVMLAVALLVLGGGAGYFAAQQFVFANTIATEMVPAAPLELPATPAEGGKRILYYRNPMGLPDTSPEPKKDSMGMDYIAVYADEVDEPNTVVISTSKVQRTGFSSVAAEMREVVTSLTLPGLVAADERLQSVVSPRAEAFVESVADVTTGSHVRKGDPLLTLRFYSPEIVQAAALYVTGIKIYGFKPGKPNPELRGYRQRLENLALPAEIIKKIEKTGKVDLSMTWRAARDAIVLERNVTEGMRAMPGDQLFKLADHSRLWVLIDIPEASLAGVAVDQAVKIRIRSFASQVFEGRVALIYPELTDATRSIKARIELANADGLLRPGMYADVELQGGAVAELALPESAVIDSGSRRIAIIEKSEGKFEPREVKTGRRGGGYVEILEGLAQGEKVVASANFLIDAESNLKAALTGLTEPGAAK